MGGWDVVTIYKKIHPLPRMQREHRAANQLLKNVDNVFFPSIWFIDHCFFFLIAKTFAFLYPTLSLLNNWTTSTELVYVCVNEMFRG